MNYSSSSFAMLSCYAQARVRIDAIFSRWVSRSLLPKTPKHFAKANVYRPGPSNTVTASETPSVAFCNLDPCWNDSDSFEPTSQPHCSFAGWAIDVDGLCIVGVLATRSFEGRFVLRRLDAGVCSGSVLRKFSIFASAGQVPRDPEVHL